MVDTSREAELLSPGVVAVAIEELECSDPIDMPDRRGIATLIRALLSERDALRARAEKAEAARDDLLARSVIAQNSHSITLAERDQARADLAATKARVVEAMRALYKGYVNTLENGRDRIMFFGGSCDPVDVMERNDPNLRAARALIEEWK